MQESATDKQIREAAYDNYEPDNKEVTVELLRGGKVVEMHPFSNATKAAAFIVECGYSDYAYRDMAKSIIIANNRVIKFDCPSTDGGMVGIVYPTYMPGARETALSKDKTRIRKTKKSWEDHFEGLKKYKEEHSHCNVSPTDKRYPGLGQWISRQRAQYKLLNEGKPSSMTPDRIQELEEVGIVWNLKTQKKWEDRFEDLKKYKEDHRHCNVSTTDKRFPQLGRWVDNQRQQYKLLNEGKHSPMTPDRIQELEGVGFVWKIGSGRGFKGPQDGMCQ